MHVMVGTCKVCTSVTIAGASQEQNRLPMLCQPLLGVGLCSSVLTRGRFLSILDHDIQETQQD